jgi:hypothetical protein
VDCALKGGLPGVELDPIGEYDSLGAEVVYIEVLGAEGVIPPSADGPANWYVLSIGLEGT